MFTPVAVNTPRHLDPDAPACQPCIWPVLMRTPIYNPYQHRFHAADVQRAAQRCAEIAQQRPTWPRSRVRATVAREMNLATTQLRYLLLQANEQPTPDTPSLAA